MILFSKLKPLYLYRNRNIRLNTSSKNRKEGLLIFLSSSNLKASIDMMNAPMLESKNVIRSYYMPYKEKLAIGSQHRNVQLDQSIIYKSVKNSSRYVNKTAKTLTQYIPNNVYYDLSFINQHLAEKGALLQKVKSYVSNWELALNDKGVESYKDKYILIDFETYEGDIRRYVKNKGDFSNFVEFLYLCVSKYPQFLSIFKGYKAVMMDNINNFTFTLDIENLNRKDMTMILNNLSIMNKIRRNEKLDEDEQTQLTTSMSAPVDEEPNSVETVTNTVTKTIMKGMGIPDGQNQIMSLTGETSDIQDKMEDIIDQTIEDKNIDKKKLVKDPKALETELNDNKEFIDVLHQMKTEQITAIKSSGMTKRDEELRKKQREIKINQEGKSIEEIQKEVREKKLEPKKVEVPNLSKDNKFKESRLASFESSYNERQLDKDVINVFDSFAKNRDIPMYIRKISKENTSDHFNKKETYTIEFEDNRRVRHNIKIDVPIFINDKFLFLGGNKKMVLKQFMPLPVVKTAPDKVQVVSNYNKVFLIRYGQKLSPILERFKKFMSTYNSKAYTVITGDSTTLNAKYITTLEYDDLASSISEIVIGKDIFVYFNQDSLRRELDKMNLDYMNLKINQLPIGFIGKDMLILNTDDNLIENFNEGLIEFLENRITEKDKGAKEVLDGLTVGKRYLYTRASIGSRKIPLAFMLGYKDGLTALLHKANIKTEFSEKRRRLSPEEKVSKGILEFSDGYLYFNKNDIATSLILNGFCEISSKEFKYSDFDNKDSYVEIFYEITGSRQMAKILDNFFNNFLDPITLEVLEDYDMPTDFTSLFLYANNLLCDTQMKSDNDMHNYRFRSNEIVPVLLYQTLADAYSVYVNTANSANPIKMSVPQDKLMKEINKYVNIEDYSTLSPILELEKSNNITYKGIGGLILAHIKLL